MEFLFQLLPIDLSDYTLRRQCQRVSLPRYYQNIPKQFPLHLTALFTSGFLSIPQPSLVMDNITKQIWTDLTSLLIWLYYYAELPLSSLPSFSLAAIQPRCQKSWKPWHLLSQQKDKSPLTQSVSLANCFWLVLTSNYFNSPAKLALMMRYQYHSH